MTSTTISSPSPSPSDPVIRVLLVDDQPLIRTGLAAILSTEPGIEVVGEAGDGTEAIRAAETRQPDVICMDVQMPGINGIEATRAIVASKTNHAAVLILTTFDRDEFIFESLRAGAAGFLLKTAGPEELIHAIRVLHAGEALLAPQITARVLAEFSQTGSAPATTETPVDEAVNDSSAAAPPSPLTHAAGPEALETLTSREAEILQWVAAGYSNPEIAAELFVGTETVKTHVSNVLSKLRVKDRVHAIVWAYEHGVAGRARG